MALKEKYQQDFQFHIFQKIHEPKNIQNVVRDDDDENS